MPDWATTLAAVIITAIIAPIVTDFLRRRRNIADTEKTDAETEKTRAETRLIEIQEVEARVKRLIDTATNGTTELFEQQRVEIVELRNRVRDQDMQISIMSETINSLVAQVRRFEVERDELKAQLESVNAANLSLLQRVEGIVP